MADPQVQLIFYKPDPERDITSASCQGDVQLSRRLGPYMGTMWQSPVVTVILLLSAFGTVWGARVSQPGGAGHALLFRNHVLLKTDFKNFPTTELTFESWVSSSDFCNAGTLMSYAKNSNSKDLSQRTADFNHFVIFDVRNVLACHDFEYIDLIPDHRNASCHASFRNTSGADETASLTSRTGIWRHIAVTWSAANSGLTKIYVNGLLMSSAYTHKTAPLEPGGAFMLGGEQDCYGGCTDPTQGFNGLLDEVRIWRTVRSQEQILQHMRWVTGLERDPDLVAYWKFNEPDQDEGQFRLHTVTQDSSMYENNLYMMSPPQLIPAELVPPGGITLHTGAITFRNDFAINKQASAMPDKSFTIEMWARGGRLVAEQEVAKTETLLSYATQKLDQEGIPTGFMDDGIRLERVQKDLSFKLLEPFWATSTVGSIRIHINSNEHQDLTDGTSWLDFDAGWTDGEWHHIAVTWDQTSGRVTCLLDGQAKTAFWRNDRGMAEQHPPSMGGVEPHIAAGSVRSSTGALVLGQDQNCPGGCFQASHAFRGDMSVVRIWRRALSTNEILLNMPHVHPGNRDGLAALYLLGGTDVHEDKGRSTLLDSSGSGNHLLFRSDIPLYEYSTAPLTMTDGRPVKPPSPGAGGYSLSLSDQQVLLLTDFSDFPSTAITVEFWMWSADGCRKGVPFSYATGPYQQQDNAFLIFNYNSLGVAVMEDEGHVGDHTSGVAATDGHWHHIAVTWDSATGKVILYDNGRPVWRVFRAMGKSIPSGGTLVIGREQDCMGGCFDSAAGAAGQIQRIMEQEYGAQDFFGVIEEMRIWKVARTAEQIRLGMDADDGRGPGGFDSPGVDPKHPDLVAYWKFDEGQGYVIHDATGRGHDLYITQQPAGWQVTRWLSTCGNGVVEGLEECDDGDVIGGTGCNSFCRVETGWQCRGNPSVCRKHQIPAPPPSDGRSGDSAQPPVAPHAPDPKRDSSSEHSSTGDEGQHSRGGRSPGIIVGVVLAVVVVAMAVMTVALSATTRHAILAHLPGANMIPGRSGGSTSLGPFRSLDPEMQGLLAPEFLAASPAASPPGHPGPYDPLPNGAPQFR